MFNRRHNTPARLNATIDGEYDRRPGLNLHAMRRAVGKYSIKHQ